MPLTPAAAILNPRLIDHFKRRFNCDFIIQKPADVPDGQGGSTRSWTQVVEVLGAMHALYGMEFEGQGAPDVKVTHEILIAYQAGIDPTMRVLYGTRVFDIHTVIDYAEQHLLLALMCEERFKV